MDSSIVLTLLALRAAAFDPAIDQALRPHNGAAMSVGVQRLQDDFGLSIEIRSPRFLDNHFGVTLAGGPGWHPDLRSLPESVDDQSFGAWSLYGHTRLLLEASTPIALASGRLYATIGPSLLFLPSQLSTTQLGFGIYGALGFELFAGDTYQTYPFAFFAEIGGVAHNAAQDIANRSGPIQETDNTIDRPIATGLALHGGLRIYLWR